tara:strand:- start:10 stop:165 length:156 start_codon:yes stop_codon:yes gene_type:complete
MYSFYDKFKELIGETVFFYKASISRPPTAHEIYKRFNIEAEVTEEDEEDNE